MAVTIGPVRLGTRCIEEMQAELAELKAQEYDLRVKHCYSLEHRPYSRLVNRIRKLEGDIAYTEYLRLFPLNDPRD